MAKNKVGYIKEFDSLKSIQLFLVNKWTRTIHYGNMDLVTKHYNYIRINKWVLHQVTECTLTI